MKNPLIFTNNIKGGDYYEKNYVGNNFCFVSFMYVFGM